MSRGARPCPLSAASLGSPGSTRQSGRVLLAELRLDRACTSAWRSTGRSRARSASSGSCPGFGSAGATVCPLQLGFPLGGDDGFPGYHIGERRGDREAMGALLFLFPVKGPLLGRLELAVGSTDAESARFPGGGWTTGVRAGVGADTPVGPVRFEYGVALAGTERVPGPAGALVLADRLDQPGKRRRRSWCCGPREARSVESGP